MASSDTCGLCGGSGVIQGRKCICASAGNLGARAAYLLQDAKGVEYLDWLQRFNPVWRTVYVVERLTMEYFNWLLKNANKFIEEKYAFDEWWTSYKAEMMMARPIDGCCPLCRPFVFVQDGDVYVEQGSSHATVPSKRKDEMLKRGEGDYLYCPYCFYEYGRGSVWDKERGEYVLPM